MKITTGVSKDLPTTLIRKLARYRHKVFIDLLKWNLPVKNQEELDQFDRNDTLYVVSHAEDGEINGCARLLPTCSPYLLKDIFPQLLGTGELPQAQDIWELSRFAAMDFKGNAAPGQFSSQIAIDLLKQSIACARARGVKRLITVSPLGIEKLLRRAGFAFCRAGAPVTIDGHSLFACWIEVPAP